MVNGGDIVWLLPEIIVTGVACLVLIITAITRTNERLSTVGLVVIGNLTALLVAVSHQPAGGGAVHIFGGQMVVDGYFTFFRVLFLIIATLAVFFASQRFEAIPFPELTAIIQFSLAGMLLMAGAVDFVMLLIALELMAVPVYALTAITRLRRAAVEAAMKYFALGAFASAVLIYGIAWVYGLTGTTSLAGVGAVLAQRGVAPWPLFAIGLVLVGMGFKVAAVPFHAWTPDAYQGAPTPVAAFISVGPKVAAMAMLVRILGLAFEPLALNISGAVAAIAAATMIVGNVIAISQSNIKRMLGYSSIAHTGYMLVAVAAASTSGVVAAFTGFPAVLFYGFVYAFMNFGAFAVAHVVEYQHGTNEIVGFRGLARRNMPAAIAMTVFMFALAGVPPTSGFLGKLFIIQTSVDAGLGWLAILLVVTSVISAFYYLRVVVEMFMHEPEAATTADGEVAVAMADTHAATVLAVAGLTLALGIMGNSLLNWAQEAVKLSAL